MGLHDDSSDMMTSRNTIPSTPINIQTAVELINDGEILKIAVVVTEPAECFLQITNVRYRNTALHPI